MTDELHAKIWTPDEREAWLQRFEAALDALTADELVITDKGFRGALDRARETKHERLIALWEPLVEQVGQSYLRRVRQKSTLTDEQLQRLATPEEE